MTDSLDWDWARLLIAVGRSRSLNVASRELGINQSTVSRRVAALENLAGMTLFRRQPSGTVLTESGQSLYEQALRVEAAMRDFKQTLAEVRGQKDRLVTIKASEGAASYLLSPILTHQAVGPLKLVESHLMRLEFPEVRLVSDQSTDTPDIQVLWVDAGKLPEGAQTDHVRKLLTVPFVPFCSSGYAQRKRALPAHFDQLRDFDLLHIAAYELFSSQEGLASWNALVSAEVRPRFTVDWTSAVERPLVSGAGITLLPNYSRLYAEDLMRIEMKHPPMSLAIWLKASQEALKNSRVRQVYDALASVFRWLNQELAYAEL